MERTIRIANTKTQQRYTIQTSATTLGELQDQMAAQGIDFSGMSFTEGLSKTQLLTRDSMLPTNVMYKGQPTNDLVMLLTNTTKNIASGAMDRKEAYRLVKELNLQDAIAEREGQNYTRCKTEVLESWINASKTPEPEVLSASPESPIPDIKTAPHPEFIDIVYYALKAMVTGHYICADDIAVLADLITELYKRLKESQVTISDSDIDDIIAGI